MTTLPRAFGWRPGMAADNQEGLLLYAVKHRLTVHLRYTRWNPAIEMFGTDAKYGETDPEPVVWEDRVEVLEVSRKGSSVSCRVLRSDGRKQWLQAKQIQEARDANLSEGISNRDFR